MLNKEGYESLDDVLKQGDVPLDVDTFEALANYEGALVLDTRSKTDFTKEHIPNSIFIGVDGSFAPWVGALITDLKQPIVFLADEGREKEVVIKLSRVGYDNTLGYLLGGIDAWKKAGKETDHIESITATSLAEKVKDGEFVNILDVRKPGEFESEHAEGAISLPLDFFNEKIEVLSRDKQYHVHCASGYRSLVAVSILKSRGYHNLVDVDGGFGAMKNTGIAKTAYVCPTTINV